MKSSVFFLWLAGILSFQAQTRINHLESLEGIKTIRFFLDEVTNAQIRITTSDTLVVKMLQDGEYAPYLQLKIVREKDEINVYNQKNIIFPNYDDKLSAHKIIVQEAVIELPENRIVYFESNTANLETTGSFQELSVQLLNGSATLRQFAGDASIVCVKGNIHAFVFSGTIRAESPQDNYQTDNIPKGESKLYLKTLTGKIDVRKTK